jgi:hypothetical protein
MPPTLPPRLFLPSQQAQIEGQPDTGTPDETAPTQNNMNPPQRPNETSEKPHKFDHGWVCCECRYCFIGHRPPGSCCPRCYHPTFPSGGEKCAECSDMVYFVESDRHLVDALPNLYQPVETGWYCARYQCDRYYKNDDVFPKHCHRCGDVGPMFGLGRRVKMK